MTLNFQDGGPFTQKSAAACWVHTQRLPGAYAVASASSPTETTDVMLPPSESGWKIQQNWLCGHFVSFCHFHTL